MSETNRCRERLKKYCNGYGCDIGYGGDPILPSAITIDIPTPYTSVGNAPLNLGGDARNLYWFRDNVLDYIFSSHLLEDFEINEMKYILEEWLRVLKPNGHLIIYCPDEQRYRTHCQKHKFPPNKAHKIENFSLHILKNILAQINDIKIIYENPQVEEYSFEIVVLKNLSAKNFDEVVYLKNNPDVDAAVKNGEFSSGFEHYIKYGVYEKRKIR